MMPELGTFALCLALGLAVLLSIYPQWGAARQDSRMMAMARPLAYGMFACIALAFIILVHAFVVNDFTVAYVANNSNTHLPVYYRVAATWGAHEGSLLLWVLLLSCWTLAVALFSRQMPQELQLRRSCGPIITGLAQIRIGHGFLSMEMPVEPPCLRQSQGIQRMWPFSLFKKLSQDPAVGQPRGDYIGCYLLGTHTSGRDDDISYISLATTREQLELDARQYLQEFLEQHPQLTEAERHALQDLADDGLRRFAARVVAGHQDAVGATLGYRAHLRPLALVAIAATAEDDHQTAISGRCHGAQRKQGILQCIRRMGVVDNDQRLVIAADLLQAPRWGRQQRKTSSHFGRRQSGINQH